MKTNKKIISQWEIDDAIKSLLGLPGNFISHDNYNEICEHFRKKLLHI